MVKEVAVPAEIADELLEADQQLRQLLDASKHGAVAEELIEPARIKRWFELSERLAHELELQLSRRQN
jgi:hypothetical protein